MLGKHNGKIKKQHELNHLSPLSRNLQINISEFFLGLLTKPKFCTRHLIQHKCLSSLPHAGSATIYCMRDVIYKKEQSMSMTLLRTSIQESLEPLEMISVQSRLPL